MSGFRSSPLPRVTFSLAAGVLLLAGIVYLAGAESPAQSAGEGEALFQQKCTACHTIGGGRLVGPDLQGVTERRTTEWLTNWLSAPDKMLAANDPIATQLLQEHNNVPMPNLGLSPTEVASLIAYFGTQTAGAATNPPPATAALPAGDPAAGRELFTGSVRFANGGPPCMGCHSIAGIGALGGGALGPDLTPAFNKYGEAGLANFLATLPLPTMNAVWSRQPLLPQEQADLRAFLQQGSVSGRSVEALGQLAALAVGGAALLIAAAHLRWRNRLPGVRRPMVERARRAARTP